MLVEKEENKELGRVIMLEERKNFADFSKCSIFAKSKLQLQNFDFVGSVVQLYLTDLTHAYHSEL